MKVMIGALFAALLTLAGSVAFAADPAGIPRGGGPGGVPFGAGTQRGVQALNNSGQTGFVTVFARGSRTAVVVAVDGTRNRTERVTLVRGNSCDAIGTRVVVRLNDLVRGISRDYVSMRAANLMSGNYIAVVYGSTAPGARPVACGELYS